MPVGNPQSITADTGYPMHRRQARYAASCGVCCTHNKFIGLKGREAGGANGQIDRNECHSHSRRVGGSINTPQ